MLFAFEHCPFAIIGHISSLLKQGFRKVTKFSRKIEKTGGSKLIVYYLVKLWLVIVVVVVVAVLLVVVEVVVDVVVDVVVVVVAGAVVTVVVVGISVIVAGTVPITLFHLQ